jgi:peptide/nickel transport system substrate-binding protein
MNPIRRTKTKLFDRIISLIETTKASDRFVLRVLFFVMIFSGLFLTYTLNQQHSSETSIAGGTLREGIVGTPRFVNPALAIARADQDMTALVYSGLMKISAEGELVPDAAESLTVSEDGKTYNIILKKDLRFHDGTPLTARDVIYTIGLIQNPDLKSPLRGNWADVTIEEVGEYEFNVVLNEPYAPFIENFQFGIMPAHLWSALSVEQIPFSQLNSEPIGAGPFRITKALRDESGVINKYILTADKAQSNKANIDTLEVTFYAEEAKLIEAFDKDMVDASAYVSNEHIATVLENDHYTNIQTPLPRIFGVFFNQNKSAALRDKAVREALSIATNRQHIIDAQLFKQGVPNNTPVVSNVNELQSTEGSEVSHEENIERAKRILNEAGWIKNNQGLLEKQIDGSAETLSITLRTSNVPLFDSITQSVSNDWKALGVEVSTEQFDQADLVQSVIRPRDFQALLFGLDMSRTGDLYPFWHSSQKDDPGLNIAQYTNLSVDAILEETRTMRDVASRTARLQDASSIIEEEQPAIFLFQPMMSYIVHKDAVIVPTKNISNPADRFNTVSDWYTDSDLLWNFFRNND